MSYEGILWLFCVESGLLMEGFFLRPKINPKCTG